MVTAKVGLTGTVVGADESTNGAMGELNGAVRMKIGGA